MIGRLIALYDVCCGANFFNSSFFIFFVYFFRQPLTVDEISVVISDIIYLHRISSNKLTIAGFVDTVCARATASTPFRFLRVQSTMITTISH